MSHKSGVPPSYKSNRTKMSHGELVSLVANLEQALNAIGYTLQLEDRFLDIEARLTALEP